MRARGKDHDRSEGVYAITGVRRGLSEDVHARERRYLISMGVRTAFFLAAIFTGGWLRWVCLAGAVVLPYVAVVVANAGRESGQDLPQVLDPRRALETGADPSEDGEKDSPPRAS